MRTCYLHIGMNKSGSTSIQQAFKGYRDAQVEYLHLKDWAPPFHDNGNHSRHLAMRFGRKVPVRFYTSPDPDLQAAERDRIARDFDAAVQAARASLVISGETMVDWRNAEPIGAAAAYLREQFDRVQGIVYVRDPVGYMKSLLQQSIRVRPLPPAMELDRFYPGYGNRLMHWETALGAGRLEFVPFNNAAFPEGDLLLDFARRTGIPDRIARKRAAFRTTNVSLSAEAVAVLARYRQVHGARPAHGRLQAADVRIVSALMRFGTQRFGLSPAVVAPVLATNAADLAWVEGRLGRPFVTTDADARAVTFATTDEILDFGAQLGPALQGWQARQFPKIAPAGGQPEDILAALRDALVETAPVD